MHGIFWELLVPAAFAVLGCVFLSGHGAGLIAGYNTMRRTERENTTNERCAGSWGG